jgi:hypothetical protein
LAARIRLIFFVGRARRSEKNQLYLAERSKHGFDLR